MIVSDLVEGDLRPTERARPFMLDEIYEQPRAIAATIDRHVDDETIFGSALAPVTAALAASNRLIIAASGSSRHAGLAGEIMIEDLAGVAVDVEYASEYCYRSSHATADPVVLAITQSGETADTIAALREASGRGAATISICNVPGATIAREATASLLTAAGPERAVPATKSFTTQLVVLYLVALALARRNGRMTAEVARGHVDALRELTAGLVDKIAVWDSACARMADVYGAARTYLYLGRGVHYAIAREGALKLKEISYAHAEGYPAGELKHGPNALVDQNCPVVVIATHDPADPDSLLRYRKTLGTIADIRAAGGSVIAVANERDEAAPALASDVLFVPACAELLLPIVEVIPLQLFAYHVARANGCDVDRPRNLVKSVVRE